MKWLLLVILVITEPSPRISVEREIEIETEELCKEAVSVIVKSVEGPTVGISGICIKVRE